MTGARSTLTPAARSCLPQTVARLRSVVVDQVPCVRALGIEENPGPRSTCTAPSSWSVATNNGTPYVAIVVARSRSVRETRAVAAVPATLRPVSMTLPTW